MARKKMKQSPKAKAKVEKVEKEFKKGELHSGSKDGALGDQPKTGNRHCIERSFKSSKETKKAKSEVF